MLRSLLLHLRFITLFPKKHSLQMPHFSDFSRTLLPKFKPVIALLFNSLDYLNYENELFKSVIVKTEE
jgi:hypothetical protein